MVSIFFMVSFGVNLAEVLQSKDANLLFHSFKTHSKLLYDHKVLQSKP